MCAHCGTRMLIRTTRQVIETYREGWAICIACSYMCKFSVSILAEGAPSISPNPRVNVPRMPAHQATTDVAASLAADSDQMDLFLRSG
jgi:hypothetical protein